MRQLANPLGVIEAQRGHLFPWAAVCFGAGVGLYFLLRTEPGADDYALLGVFAVCGLLAVRWFGGRTAPLFTAMTLVALGVTTAGGHARWATAPVLEFRYYGPVEGRVLKVDRSQSGKMRLTLDQVILEDRSPARTPARVRVSLQQDPQVIAPEPGMRVILTANLSPPPGPAEPGGFDFRRNAWFERLGAVGFSRAPVLRPRPAEPGGPSVWIASLRARISAYVQKELRGEAGAFAAAIMTGDRSGIGQQTVSALRGSNLAHLLAISGLHMGLLTAFVFAAMRYGLALIPGVALHWPVKKIAAVVALGVAVFYLALSGGNVATVRAFIMVSVMLVAVLLDRRALTLHAVSVAALIVLLLQPESLVGPGFQMSFAATVALVAVFGWLRNWRGPNLPRALRPVLAVVISSGVAGAATAPFAAASFNQIAQYGLLANLLSVPLMGSVVVPAAVLAAVLTPIGLGWVGFAVMELGIRWILGVATWVSGLDGALYFVVTPGPAVIPLIALGMLFVILWRGRWRAAGFAVALAGGAIWAGTERPALLVSDSGGLVGVMTESGRALNKPKGEGFVARSWLENDGDPAIQARAFERAGFEGARGRMRLALGGVDFMVLSGRGATEALVEYCTGTRWVILAARADVTSNCRLWDQNELAKSGSLAFYERPDGLRMVSAAELSGQRLWTGR